jgi:hypothetical protein
MVARAMKVENMEGGSMPGEVRAAAAQARHICTHANEGHIRSENDVYNGATLRVKLWLVWYQWAQHLT